MPVIFFVWGLFSLYQLHGLSLARVLPWALALVGGTAIGMAIANLQPIRADKMRHIVRMPGGPFLTSTCCLISTSMPAPRAI